jgi:hypothetical protein
MSANKLLHQSRQFAVSIAAASARIEGLKLSKKLEKNLYNYIVGKKSIHQLIEQSKQRYISQRIKR